MRKVCDVFTLVLTLFLPFAAVPLKAHEFWIDPVTFTPKLGATVPIVFRIGSDFLGGTYPFVRALNSRLALHDAGGERGVKAIDGDDPAFDVKFTRPGLSVLVHERKAEEVIFATFDQYEVNLKYEGLEYVIAAHRARGLPLTSIREHYTRHAKALIQVGDTTQGTDRAVGMTLELIALSNPYTLLPTALLPIQLLFKGKPVSNALVKAHSATNRQSPVLARTDAEGRVAFDITQRGDYLISAVYATEPEPTTKAEWISFWASLTFVK
jgi:uncharacterized GH25 family protein